MEVALREEVHEPFSIDFQSALKVLEWRGGSYLDTSWEDYTVLFEVLDAKGILHSCRGSVRGWPYSTGPRHR